jgi:protein N-terminal amidase
MSMAWLTFEDARSFGSAPKLPDIKTISYWTSRLEPVIRANDVGEIIVVFANRCGVEGDTVFVGTSCVLGINEGEVAVYGILGRCDQELLVVDTEEKPKTRLVSEPSPAASNTTNATTESSEGSDAAAAESRWRLALG